MCQVNRTARVAVALAAGSTLGWLGCADGPTESLEVASVTVTPRTAALRVGEAMRLAAEARDANGNVLTGATIAWSSDGTVAALVDSSGLVVGMSPGTATVSATSGGVRGSATVGVSEQGPRDPIVSDAVSVVRSATAAPAGPPAGSQGFAGVASGDLVYVSLPPGTVPEGGLATVRNPRTGQAVPAAMAEGGFDPVGIVAGPGDELAVEILVSGGGTVWLTLMVPIARPPIVVRTNPPRRKVDVVLNAAMLVVFSEPVDPATVSGIQLFGGGTRIDGRAVLSADGLRVTFEPAQRLAPNTGYVLAIPTEVRDLSGDTLESAVAVDFTTGTALAVASVSTPEAALFVNPFGGNLRAINFSAQLLDDGRYVGAYHLFYPETGLSIHGTVKCLATDGAAAWVAGIADSTADGPARGMGHGWRAVDHGPPGGAVADQLSLNHPLVEGGVRSPLEWCATKPVVDPYFGNVVLHDLMGGDVAVEGEAPPPPPPLPPVIVGIDIARRTGTLAPGERVKHTAWSIDDQGTPTVIGDTVVAWASSDSTIATVTRYGVVVGVRPGAVTITAAWAGHDAAVSVTVSGSAGAQVRLSWIRTAPGLVLTGSTQEYVVGAPDTLGYSQSGVPIAWTLTADDGSIQPAVDTTAFDSEYGAPTSRAVHTLGPGEGRSIVQAALVDAPETTVTDTATAVTAIVSVVCPGFVGGSVEVASGLTVGWAFRAGCGPFAPPRSHNVTFEDGAAGSPTMAFGAFARTFTGEPRQIRFRCAVHSSDFDGPAGEVGTVIVR